MQTQHVSSFALLVTTAASLLSPLNEMIVINEAILSTTVYRYSIQIFCYVRLETPKLIHLCMYSFFHTNAFT